MSEKPFYLAGPMSGIAQFNFPLFHSVAESLRNKGFSIISPAEEDTPEVQAEAIKSKDGSLTNGKIGGLTWGEILAKDVILVADKVQGIIFLPEWYNSRGAKLEAVVGLLQGIDFRFGLWDGYDVFWMYHDDVLDLVYEGLSVSPRSRDRGAA